MGQLKKFCSAFFRPLKLYFLLLFGIIYFQPAVAHSFEYDMPYYGGPWAVIHRDNRNSDYIPALIADKYVPVFQTFQYFHSIYNRSTIGPGGNICYTYRILSTESTSQDSYYSCHDGFTGEKKFTIVPPTVDKHLTAGNSLIGYQGSSYISDNQALMKFSSAGKLLWRILVAGVQASGVQFTPDGKILMMSWNGWVYVVEPSDGTLLLEKNMTPNRWYLSDGMSMCFLDGNSSDCAYANIPAVDPYSYRVYQTFNPSDGGPAAVHAYQYSTDPYDFKLVWSTKTFEGGTASSVTLSSDYQRLYVSDRAENLLALDALTGDILWKVPVGFDACQSAVANPNGFIVPGGCGRGVYNRLVIVQDQGGQGEVVFENDNYEPLSSTAAGLDNRFVVFARENNTNEIKLIVFHPTEGIIGVSSWNNDLSPDQLVGVSIDEKGWVYVNGWGNLGVKVFKPEPE